MLIQIQTVVAQMILAIMIWRLMKKRVSGIRIAEFNVDLLNTRILYQLPTVCIWHAGCGITGIVSYIYNQSKHWPQ